ncbi:MAG: hypothetical protein K6G42_02740 [Lachnospiraceae bacterium]|nr:hypothetical protein [Lachnospiraceae bacterium]
MDNLNNVKLNDENLEQVNGGTGEKFYLDNDPLYLKFLSIISEKLPDKGDGMSSRAAMISSFRNWINNGMPENIGDTGKNKKA